MYSYSEAYDDVVDDKCYEIRDLKGDVIATVYSMNEVESLLSHLNRQVTETENV